MTAPDSNEQRKQEVIAALADPNERLALILEATVTAFEANPSEALQFHPTQSAHLVFHDHWPLPADVVRAHDLDQLDDLGLIAAAPAERSLTFGPQSADAPSSTTRWLTLSGLREKPRMKAKNLG